MPLFLLQTGNVAYLIFKINKNIDKYYFFVLLYTGFVCINHRSECELGQWNALVGIKKREGDDKDVFVVPLSLTFLAS